MRESKLPQSIMEILQPINHGIEQAFQKLGMKFYSSVSELGATQTEYRLFVSVQESVIAETSFTIDTHVGITTSEYNQIVSGFINWTLLQGMINAKVESESKDRIDQVVNNVVFLKTKIDPTKH